jgi:hypothetical protein
LYIRAGSLSQRTCGLQLFCESWFHDGCGFW